MKVPEFLHSTEDTGFIARAWVFQVVSSRVSHCENPGKAWDFGFCVSPPLCFLPLCACGVCTLVCASRCLCMHVCGGHRKTSNVLICHPALSLWDRVLLARLAASRHSKIILFSLHLTVLELEPSGFAMGYRDSNSSPYVCAVSILLH